MELTLQNIRKECENNPELYGAAICDRTWQRWGRLAMGNLDKKTYCYQNMVVSKETAIMFFALARFRRLNPEKKITWGELKKYACTQEASHLNFAPAVFTCRDLPAIIKSSLRISLSERSLYTISKKMNLPFSRNRSLTDEEIAHWLIAVENYKTNQAAKLRTRKSAKQSVETSIIR